ncbi:MAG: hypothetical protein DRO98_05030 [Archaeoglobales archaeon]|nr:MAG: hypothetical protein DRO98_05030 [Archaeoglobales archaeon]
MRVHKQKYERAVELLKEGKSPKEIAKKVGLSIKQILEIAELHDIYVDLDELKKKKNEKAEVVA